VQDREFYDKDQGVPGLSRDICLEITVMFSSVASRDVVHILVCARRKNREQVRSGVLRQRKRMPAYHGEYQLVACHGSALHLNPVHERAKVIP